MFWRVASEEMISTPAGQDGIGFVALVVSSESGVDDEFHGLGVSFLICSMRVRRRRVLGVRVDDEDAVAEDVMGGVAMTCRRAWRWRRRRRRRRLDVERSSAARLVAGSKSTRNSKKRDFMASPSDA